MRIQDQRSPDGAPAPSRPTATPALVFWVIWVAILGGATVIYTVLGRRSIPNPNGGLLTWFGLVPLAVSVAIRWLLLPRMKDRSRALVIFILGLSTAEAATIFATFFATGQPQMIVAASGLLGILMWAPVFAKDSPSTRQN